MCGVFGMVALACVIPELMKAAARMENRGAQSVGVATLEPDGQFLVYKKAAPAEIAFYDWDSDAHRGTSGIVHTRYATTGTHTKQSILRNAGPSVGELVAITHNGDTVNAELLRAQLAARGVALTSETDTEIIRCLVEDALRAETILATDSMREYAVKLFAALAKVQAQIIGAYSLVILTRRGVCGWRGQAGIRPLLWATKQNAAGGIKAVGFASESSVFNALTGWSDITDVLPGEAFFVPNDLSGIYRHRLSEAPERLCFFEFLYLARPDSRFNRRRVEMARRDLGIAVARERAADFARYASTDTVVVPIPTCPVNAAQAFAAELGLPVAHAIIKLGNKRSFMETSEEKRERAIDDKFAFIKEMVVGKHVILFDDSIVRGPTSRKLVARVLSLGALSAGVVSLCPRMFGACFYGVDTPDCNKLIAWDAINHRVLTEAEIARAIGADWVVYLSVAGLVAGSQLPPDSFCLGCVTGEYPTPLCGADSKCQRRVEDRDGS